MGFIDGTIPGQLLHAIFILRIQWFEIQKLRSFYQSVKFIFVTVKLKTLIFAVSRIFWGDEGKGKLVAYLAKLEVTTLFVDGQEAIMLVIPVKDGKRYKTNLIPSGIFYGIPLLDQIV